MGAEESTFAERRGGGGPGGEEPLCAAAAAGRGTRTVGRHGRRRKTKMRHARNDTARALQDYGIREALERRSNVRSCPCRHRPSS